MKTTTGFLGYRSSMQFHGLEREIFNAEMLIRKQELEFQRAIHLFGDDAVLREKRLKKRKPLVYGK